MNSMETNQAQLKQLQGAFRAADLIFRFRQDQLSPEEVVEFMQWRSESEQNEQTYKQMSDEGHVGKMLEEYHVHKRSEDEVFSKLVLPKIKGGWEAPIVKKISWHKYMLGVAASLVLVAALGGLWYFGHRSSFSPGQAPMVVTSNKEAAPAPGSNHATLILGDGKVMTLNGVANGLLVKQGTTNVVKTNEGTLTYEASVSNGGEALRNTVVTPKGGMYALVLPDGSKVWLDADSKLRFPVAFTGTERVVELAGEAYFEVAKDRAKPFKVKVSGKNTEIQVLGTHFNVSAYDEDSILKTTLLEGSVKVTNGTHSTLLIPGQQARVDISNGVFQVVNEPRAAETAAWKDGTFMFHESLPEIMRQIGRWYNLDVVYVGNCGELPKTFSFGKKFELSKVFEELEFIGLAHCKLEGKKIIVTPLEKE